MTEDKEIKREVNGTQIQTNGPRPDTKIWIGRVQNKLAVDSPRGETKIPLVPGGDLRSSCGKDRQAYI
jgi:hypothetical protein